MADFSKLVPFSAIPARLQSRGISITYSILWQNAMAGRVPHTRIGRALFAHADDLPEIASALTAYKSSPNPAA